MAKSDLFFEQESVWKQKTERYQEQVLMDIKKNIPKDVKSIVDVGCGDGYIIDTLASDYDVLGIDYSKTALKNVNSKSMVGNLLDIPLEDNSFDLVMVNDVLEHLTPSDRQIALREISRVSRKYVIITVPFMEQLEIGEKKCGNCGRKYHINHHYKSFQLRELKNLFEENNYNCCRQIMTGDFWSYKKLEQSIFDKIITKEEVAIACCPHCNSKKIEPLAKGYDFVKLENSSIGSYDYKSYNDVRTECINIYVKSNDIANLRDLSSKSIEAFNDKQVYKSNIISTKKLNQYSLEYLPTSGQIPYVLPFNKENNTLKFGFFGKVESNELFLKIKGTSNKNNLKISRYDNESYYCDTITYEVEEQFEIKYYLDDLRPSRYGFLFQIDTDFGAVTINEIKLEGIENHSVEYMSKPDAQYLKLDNGVYLSLDLYGEKIHVLNWFYDLNQLTELYNNFIKIDLDEVSQRIIRLSEEISKTQIDKYALNISEELEKIGREVLILKEMYEVGNQKSETLYTAKLLKITEDLESVIHNDSNIISTLEAFEQMVVDKVDALENRLGNYSDSGLNNLETLKNELSTQSEDQLNKMETLTKRINDVSENELRIKNQLDRLNDSIGNLNKFELLENILKRLEESNHSTTLIKQQLIKEMEMKADSKLSALSMRIDDIFLENEKISKRLSEVESGNTIVAECLDQVVESNMKIDALSQLYTNELGKKDKKTIKNRLRSKIKKLGKNTWISWKEYKYNLLCLSKPEQYHEEFNRFDGNEKTFTMICHDQDIDRRIIQQALSLEKEGYQGIIVCLSYNQNEYCEKYNDNILLHRISLNKIVPDCECYEAYHKRQNYINWWGRGFKVLSKINHILYKVDLARTYKNKRIQYPLSFDNCFLYTAMNYKSNLVVAHDLPALRAGVLVSQMWKVPCVFDSHEFYHEQKVFSSYQKQIMEKYSSEFIPYCDLVLTVNGTFAELFKSKYNAKKSEVILNSVDKTDLLSKGNKFHKLLELDKNQKILLYQGGMTNDRNIPNVIKGFKKAQLDNYHLTLIGPYDKALLQKLKKIAGSHLDKTIHFFEPVPQQELPSYTSSADFGVIPYPAIDFNTKHCTPNKMFEYIQSGLPFIGNDLVEVKKIVDQLGGGAFITNLDTADNMARAMKTMASRDLRAERKLILKAKDIFTWDVEEKKYLEYIKELK